MSEWKPISKAPQAHWVKIQYDPDLKHFLIDGSYKHTPANMFIDGYTAHKRLQEYIACMMHEVEDIQRHERTKKEDTAQ